MRINSQKQDIILLLLLILIIVGLPFSIRAYDRYLEPTALIPDAREFTLTGNAKKGCVLGEGRANDIISLWQEGGPAVKPVIEVSKGDQMVIKLRSADATHGFSLKAFGIYVAKSI